MSITDLHPENLLDKEIRGDLASADRQRLEAHLAGCATCRFERQARAEFALELSRDGLAPDLAALVETVAKQGGREPQVRVRSPRARRAQVILLSVAATLTIVVGAFASTEGGRRVLAPFFVRAAASTTYDEGASAVPSGRPHASPRANIVAPPTPEALPSAATTSLESSVAPVPDAPVGSASTESAASFFGAEAEARRLGDLAKVLELHAKLVARSPDSHETQASRMVVAHMLLDRGDAGRALSAFDAYLRAGSGELREDAFAGRATALERLGRNEDARQAWMTLLDRYPGTAYAAYARARTEGAGGP